jgi:hypothetical protein
MQIVQTQDEVLRLFDEYQRGGYAPSDLILDGDNGKTMFDFVIAKWGVISITYLREAEQFLGAKLKRTKAPTQAEIEAERVAKGNARMRKDYLDSLRPQKTLEQQKTGQARLDANKKAANGKELKSINSQIEREISEHVVGHPRIGIDYSRTDSERDTLREARDKHADRHTIEGARRALSAVKTAKSKL